MPEISIIVPVYRVEQYLDRCINSILNQTYKDFELILIDDGSPDKCPEMCDEWGKKDKRIKVFHKKNGGLSSARNIGLEVYKGNYVFFVDSDDWIEKNALEILHQIAVETKADIVVGNHCRDKKYYICEDKRNYRKKAKYKIYGRDTYLDMYLKVTEQKTRYYAWAKLYTSEVASQIHYPEGYTSEDVAGTFYAIANSKYIVETDCVVYHYFENRTGITKKALSRIYLDMYHSWDYVINYSKLNLPEYVEKCEYNLMRIDLPVLISFVVRPINKEYIEYLSDMRSIKRRLNRNYIKIMQGSLPVKKKFVLTLCRIIPINVFMFFCKVKFKNIEDAK